MNLVMELPWIQISFECCDGIPIPYMDKTYWCEYGGIEVRDAGTCLKKRGRNLGGGTISGEGVTIEVSSGMGGRVILAGKS